MVELTGALTEVQCRIPGYRERRARLSEFDAICALILSPLSALGWDMTDIEKVIDADHR